MGAGTFLLLFILTPLFVDVVLLIIALSVQGKKIFLLFLLILYLTFNVVVPILVLHRYYLEKIGNKQMVYAIAFIIFLRLLEIFGASFGKTFLGLWRNT